MSALLALLLVKSEILSMEILEMERMGSGPLDLEAPTKITQGEGRYQVVREL